MKVLNKKISYALTVALVFIVGNYCSSLFAATNYVDLHGSNILPYDTWAKAATNIQSAIDATVAGDVVLVTDGCYEVSAQIVITNGIAVRSVNGATATTIGRIGPEDHRLVYLGHGEALLNGFTLTNGVASGENLDGEGGGLLMVEGATIENCVVSDNEAGKFGGGISFGNDVGGFVQHCVISRNQSQWDGGGIFGYGCTVQNSDILNNISGSDGGGVHLGAGGGVVDACRIENNVSGRTGGGVLARGGDIIRSCLIVGNVASNDGGGVGYNINSGHILNCTIVRNTAPTGGGINGGTVENTILYDNSAQNGPNYSTGTFSYCCSVPTPEGTGNTSADPQFRAPSGFRLGPSSPCIDTGTNQYWMSDSYDLDGAPRIVHGARDMGAYEYRESPLPLSIIADTIVINWNVLSGETYRFERSQNLESTNWVPLYEESWGDSTNVMLFDSSAAGMGFYRAVYLPPE